MRTCEDAVGTPGTETSAKRIAGQCCSLKEDSNGAGCGDRYRCDFVGICFSDAPCLTEAMQRRGLSSFSLLRSDGVGNHDAQTREKMLSWLSEKRPQKAWFSPPVITHQNNSTRCSLRSRQMFRKFFVYAAEVLRGGGHIYWEWPAKCIGWSSVELREFRAQQKSCGRELFMTACDSCFFAKRKQSAGTSSLAIPHN